MSSLLPIKFRTELARQFHRTITNTINVTTDVRNSLTPVENTVFVYTATAGQSEFSGGDDYADPPSNPRLLSYTPGRVEVYKNGSKLLNSQYIASDGNEIILNTACDAGDNILIVLVDVFTFPNPSDYYYIFLGKTTEWDNGVPTPEDTRTDDSQTKRDILAVKRVLPSDTALLIPRIDWDVSGNTIYDAYSDNSEFGVNFYVMNTSFRIYKCIFSPGSPSTVQPETTLAGPFRTFDGYWWQLMYEIPSAERVKFLTDDFIPVRFYSTSSTFDHNAIIDEIVLQTGGTGYTSTPSVIIFGDGNGATAVANMSSGVEKEVLSITVTNGGAGYSFALVQIIGGGGSGATAEAILLASDLPLSINQDVASYALSAGAGINFIEVTNQGTEYLTSSTQIQIIGDGEGARGSATVVDGKVTSITVLDKGRGYTFADVVITGAGANATARAVIEPQGGHGSDIPKELFSKVVGISINIEDFLDDFFLDNDFRQIGVIKNVKDYYESQIFSSITGTPCYKITVTNPEAYNLDDVLLTNTGGRFIVVNKINSVIFLLPVVDSISLTSVLENETTGLGSYTIQQISIPEISTKTGDIIYVRNLGLITRQVGQVEQLKLYFSF
jgi:hypothetical protein